MLFTFLRTIRGWFTDIPYCRGRGGIRIPESGMKARTSRSESALESVSSGVLDGAGLIGDSIGITDTQFITAPGTTPGAPRFTTGTITTGEEARAAGFPPARVPESGLLPEPPGGAAEFTTVLAERPGLSREITKLPEDTRNLAVRAEPALELSAATTVADRQGAIRRAEAGALVAVQRAAAVQRLAVVVEHLAERLAAAVVGIGNRGLAGAQA